MSAVAVIGGGPAGLMAAEVLASAGAQVTIYDRMPSLGRKLLMAGRSGLNLTHSEDRDRFAERYCPASPRLRAALDAFPPEALRAWSDGLGQETFVGSSGRVFPRAWKASPLLRAWLTRLGGLRVQFALRHRWTGIAPDGGLLFAGPDGAAVTARADAVVLALGGASWPRLGSDGLWRPAIDAIGVGSTPFAPANCGVQVPWSDRFRDTFAGEPLKRIALTFAGQRRRGEAVVTAAGLEGGVVYATSGAIRDAPRLGGNVTLSVDLRPDLDAADLARALGRPRAKQSTSTFLRKTAGLAPVGVALLREAAGPALPADPASLAALIKAVPVRVTGTDSLDRAISSAGGVRLDELDDGFMLRRRPGMFAAGEMLDWEAPTGGYLLQACFSTGRVAGESALVWLGSVRP